MPAQFPLIFGNAAVVVLIAGFAYAGSKKDKTAHGTVTATGCSVAWSDTELAPLVPMAPITGGTA